MNQAIKDLKDQMLQMSQNSNELRDALTAMATANTQQQQIQQLVQQQVQQQLQQQPQQQPQQQQQQPTRPQGDWNHDYDVLQPPAVPDEKDKENAELKAQIAVLKATLSARQSAASVPSIPSYPNARTTLNWSPAEHASTIPSWQQKSTSSPSPTSTSSPARPPSSPVPPQIQPIQQYQPRPITPQQGNQSPTLQSQPQPQPQQPQPQSQSQPQPPQQQAPTNTTTTTTTTSSQPQADSNPPYSSAFTDIFQLVQDKSLSKEELHKRLNIRDIDDKPKGIYSSFIIKFLFNFLTKIFFL